MSISQLFYVCDPEAGESVSFDNPSDALAYGQSVINEYRDNCDPEWPSGVEDLCIVYGAPSKDSDDAVWQELPTVYRCVETDRREFDTEEEAKAAGCEYMCDYKFELVAS